MTRLTRRGKIVLTGTACAAAFAFGLLWPYAVTKAGADTPNVSVTAVQHVDYGSGGGADFTVCNERSFPADLQTNPDNSDRDFAMVTVHTNGYDRDPASFELGAPRRVEQHCVTSTVYGSGTLTFSGSISWPDADSSSESFATSFTVPNAAPATTPAPITPVTHAAPATHPVSAPVVVHNASTVAAPTPTAPTSAAPTVTRLSYQTTATPSLSAAPAPTSDHPHSEKVLIWCAWCALGLVVIAAMYRDKLVSKR